MVQYSEREKYLLELDILKLFEYKYGVPKSEMFDNEVYYPAYYTKARYIHGYGGRGSGKSADLGGKYPVVHLSCLPFCRFLGVRQVYNTLRGSMLQEIIDYIQKWKLGKYFKITKSPMMILHKETGNFMRFAGMDKPESIKSLADPTHILFEEAFHIKDEAGFNKIDDSVRTPLIADEKQKIIFIYNPDNKDHFLYNNWFDPEFENQFKEVREDSLIINTTYKDNKFLSKKVGQRYERIKNSDKQRYKVDVLGKWGSLLTQGAFYNAFNYDYQVRTGVKQNNYDRLAPLHITFDFNVEPYVSLIANQIYFDEATGELEIAAIDEICLTDTNRMGKVAETMKEFLKRYKNHIGNVVVYGDRSGHSRKTTGKTDFATVFVYLKSTPKSKYIVGNQDGRRVEIDPYPEYDEYNCKFRVVDATSKSQNPALIVRKVLHQRMHAGQLIVLPLSRTNKTINATGAKRELSRQYGNHRIVQIIDQENCPMLIRDYMEVTEDVAKGGKSERPEHLTHTSDAEDYFICKVLDAEFTQIELEIQHKS